MLGGKPTQPLKKHPVNPAKMLVIFGSVSGESRMQRWNAFVLVFGRVRTRIKVGSTIENAGPLNTYPTQRLKFFSSMVHFAIYAVNESIYMLQRTVKVRIGSVGSILTT